MLLHLHNSQHRKILAKWLKHADTLIGVNLLFDIPMLRMIDPDFRALLYDGSHEILDFIYIRYLQSEVSRARSLKTFGPHHGLYVYDTEVNLRAGDRFEHPTHPKFVDYSTSDPHNSITSVAYAAKLILEQCSTPSSSSSSSSPSSPCSSGTGETSKPHTSGDAPCPSPSPASSSLLETSSSSVSSSTTGSTSPCSRSSSGPGTGCAPTAKLSGLSVSHYTDLWWSCVRFTESGIPMSVAALRALEEKSLAEAARLRSLMEDRGYKITGKGSQACKLKLIRRALRAADRRLEARRKLWDWDDDAEGEPPSIFDSPLVEYTEAKHELSATDANRQLALVLLPEGHPYRRVLEVWGAITSAEKLVSTYTYPLLRHHRSDPENAKSRIITWPSSDVSPALSPASCNSPSPGSGETSLLWEAASSGSMTSSPTSTAASPSTSSPASPTLPKEVLFAIAGGNPHRDIDQGVGLAFPSIFPVPSFSKDGAGDAGGQKQSRLSFKNPSAQTFPPAVKACIRSRFKGGAIWWFDLSQIELRVAGILSGEPSILQNYREGLDLHTDRCIELFTEPVLVSRYGKDWRKHPTFKDNERQWGKKFNFEDLYLAGPSKMQRIFIMETGQFLPLAFFRKVLASRYDLRPVLIQWQDHTIALAEQQGYIELPFFGQSRAFTFGAKGNAIGEIVNFPIQATAANVTHRILMALFRKLPRLSVRKQPILPFLNVYDAGALDTHPSMRSEMPGRIAEAVDYVRNSDYWAWIQEHYGRECPLSYEAKEIAA